MALNDVQRKLEKSLVLELDKPGSQDLKLVEEAEFHTPWDPTVV